MTFDKKKEIQIDPLKQIISIVSYKGNIFIDYPNRLKYKEILVTGFVSSSNMDMSLPISCYVKMSPKGEKIPCRLYLKNNNMALVEFDDVRPGLLVAGQFLVFYNRQLDKGKVIGSALVETSGVFSEWSYNTLPEKKEDPDEHNKDSSKPNHLEKLSF